jgi:hypothetical protein
MPSVDQEPNRPRSSSLDSLHVQKNLQESVLTSTTNQEHIGRELLASDRRKAIVPTPNRPSTIQSSQNIRNNDGKAGFTAIQHREIRHHSHELADGETSNDIHQPLDPNIDVQSQMNEPDNEDNFDGFILQHFVPFTGKQNVDQWLDETEN